MLAMIRRLEHSAPAPVQRCRVVGRRQHRRFPTESNVEIDRVLTLLRAKRRDGRGDVPRRRLERITTKHGDRVFPLLIYDFPVWLVDLHALAVGEIHARQVARDRFGIHCVGLDGSGTTYPTSPPATLTSTRCSAGPIACDSGRRIRRCPDCHRRRCTARRCRGRPSRTASTADSSARRAFRRHRTRSRSRRRARRRRARDPWDRSSTPCVSVCAPC